MLLIDLFNDKPGRNPVWNQLFVGGGERFVNDIVCMYAFIY